MVKNVTAWLFNAGSCSLAFNVTFFPFHATVFDSQNIVNMVVNDSGWIFSHVAVLQKTYGDHG